MKFEALLRLYLFCFKRGIRVLNRVGLYRRQEKEKEREVMNEAQVDSPRAITRSPLLCTRAGGRRVREREGKHENL